MVSRNRLGRGKDLDLVLRRGRRASHTFFSVTWRPNGMSHSRFAFVVPRSVDKRAVVRNRLRRRMREFMRIRNTLLNPPQDVVITCRREAASTEKKAFHEVLEELLFRLGKK